MRMGSVAVAIVALIHVYFAYKEFSGRNESAFYEGFNVKLHPDQDRGEVGKIVANAAAFNALLAAGLIASLLVSGGGLELKVYLLVSIVLAGIVGGKTLTPLVYALQSAPAAVALGLVLWESRSR